MQGRVAASNVVVMESVEILLACNLSLLSCHESVWCEGRVLKYLYKVDKIGNCS